MKKRNSVFIGAAFIFTITLFSLPAVTFAQGGKGTGTSTFTAGSSSGASTTGQAPTIFDNGDGYDSNAFLQGSTGDSDNLQGGQVELNGDLVQSDSTVVGNSENYGENAGLVGNNDVTLATSPQLVSLGTCPEISYSSLKNLVAFLVCLINKFFVPILATLALIFFIWGIIQYVINADNEEARAEGRKVIIWGIVGLFAMVGIWGLVNLLISTLGVN